MKRLVNAYAFQRATKIFEDQHVETSPLALWTIFEMRWPVWADWLRRDPCLIPGVVHRKHPESLNSNGVDKELFTDSELTAVLCGGHTDQIILDEEMLQSLIGWKSALSSSTR
jgi:hypothetical protein